MSETREKILPILTETYGDGSMVHALADELTARIDAWDGLAYYRSREDMIFHTCWDWCSGGSTAEAVAKEIEAAL